MDPFLGKINANNINPVRFMLIIFGIATASGSWKKIGERGEGGGGRERKGEEGKENENVKQKEDFEL